jgi:hypothetical protein
MRPLVGLSKETFETSLYLVKQAHRERVTNRRVILRTASVVRGTDPRMPGVDRGHHG